ncbi:hypothetical protein OG592_34545 [Streptomyces avidinii]|uniref:hypothetical protein n=1 Tax=Streptomyces avidinii TaxID=1895 RepID=UPI00386373FC|nr:hypothetical protein OG592_34545 [Streptomyces avidinii]
MTRLFRTRRIALFAASTAIAAGGVLIPTTAFAATPAAAHTVAADGAGDGSRTGLLLLTQSGDGDIFVNKQQGDRPAEDSSAEGGPHGNGPADRGRHHDGPDDGIRIPHGKPQWQCFAAPCEPPTGHDHDRH